VKTTRAYHGNSRVGMATAKRFVQEGAYVFITGRRQAELDKAVSLIGKNVAAVQGDVSNLGDLDRLYEVVRKVKGRIDIVFPNAGVVDPVSLTESTRKRRSLRAFPVRLERSQAELHRCSAPSSDPISRAALEVSLFLADLEDLYEYPRIIGNVRPDRMITPQVHPGIACALGQL
jgi:NAD(P)-dependent dehydrogenase (short-subunit alcohol dehydrogenase family)